MFPFQEKDLYMIEKLIEAGYGWEKYARSVLSQGKISDKQRCCLFRMLHKLGTQQIAAERRRNTMVEDDSDSSYYETQPYMNGSCW